MVPREDKYKAKSFIDTVVYRAGDQVGSWSYALLGMLGAGPGGVALGGAADLRAVARQRAVAGTATEGDGGTVRQPGDQRLKGAQARAGAAA